MLELQDQIGNMLRLQAIPKRIISLVPSQTELLYDLGLSNRVVGVTRFCVHPAHWRKKKQIVGGTKQQRTEVIKALKPDLVIANKEENEKSSIEELMDFCPVYVSDVSKIDDALKMIADIGELTDTTSKAREIVEQIEASFLNIKSLENNLSVAYCIWKDPWMWVGKDTFINDMLSHCGFSNLITQDRYPEIEIGTLLNQKPDIIFLSSEPYPFQQKHLESIKSQFNNTEISIVDGEIFSWYGSRLLNAPLYFNLLIDQLKAKFS